MKLFMSGTKVKFNQNQVPPRIKRLKEFLDKSKDGELFTSRQASTCCNLDTTNMVSDAYFIPDYSYKVGNKRYWGKPRTINQLKKETEHVDNRQGSRN